MKRDISDWLSKKQVAEALELSEKTVERLADQNKLAFDKRRRADNRWELCFSPDDVERVKAERDRPLRGSVVPLETQPEPTRALTRAAVEPNGLTALADLILSRQVSGVSIEVKLMLTEKEASELSGLPRAFLRKAREDGKLFAIKANGWRFRRSDLIRFVEGLS